MSKQAAKIEYTYEKNAFDFSALTKLEKSEYLLAIVEIVLALRFVFLLFTSSGSNILAKAFVALTSLITLPFTLLFGNVSGFGLLQAELATLTAMIVYAVGTWAGIAIAKYRASHNLADKQA